MIDNNEQEVGEESTITSVLYVLAKDMLEHKHTWRKRMYRLRKNAKSFLFYKGELCTFITEKYPQGVTTPIDVVEDIWSDVCIGNLAINIIDEDSFTIRWYQSIEALEREERLIAFNNLVYWVFDNYGNEALMAKVREGFHKGYARGLFTWEGGKISIPMTIIKKVVTAIDEDKLYVEDRENGLRDICSTYSTYYFLEELWEKVA